MDHDASFHVTILVRFCAIPKLHATASIHPIRASQWDKKSDNIPILAIRWGHEVGVVKPTAILRICNDSIVLLTTASKVILLEVARCFIEAVPVSNALKCTLMVQSQDCTPVEQIMRHVAGIKELSNSGIYVTFCLGHFCFFFTLRDGIIRE